MEVGVSERHELSEQDLAVARLVAQGRTNKQIAREMERGVGTVKDHVAAACRKLELPGRAALAAWYVRTQEKGE
jgi:DNA-binding NarL/FixJ family response regulator